MATDREQIVSNLCEFYDFAGKTVIAVGAGGELLGLARLALSVRVVEKDANAVARLTRWVQNCGAPGGVTIVHADFLSVRSGADVVLFEFCLHEMPPHGRAVDHALELAPDVVVIDHAPASPWSWYASEEHLVDGCWTAIPPALISDQRDVGAFQRFDTFADLEARMVERGPVSFARIAVLRGQSPVAIPMPYRIALLRGQSRLISNKSGAIA